MDNNLIVSPFCVDMNKFNLDFIMNLGDINYIKINGNYTLTKNDYDNLIVYSNVSIVDVYDIDDFELGKDIVVNVERKVSFDSSRYQKYDIDKINGYNKKTLSINLPFKIYFQNDILCNEEYDFMKLLNYIKDIDTLNINFESLDVIDSVIDVILKIEEKIGKKISFINCITINRTIKDIEKLHFLDNDRIIKIWYEDGIFDCGISEFVKMRCSIDSIVNNVKKKNLSDFEKVIYVYDIVKKYNYNNSFDFYSMNGRQLHKVFSTNNIVCSGFTRIISEVLNELGIRAGVYKLVTSSNTLHARCLVHICDDKYDINGIFSMDPTWESILRDDYAYSLFLTPVGRLREFFPNDHFREDINVLCGIKELSQISLKDRISLYQFFDNKDLVQNDINPFIPMCFNDINLNSFCEALINVRVAQGVSRELISLNVHNVIKFNNDLSVYLNRNFNTNLSFFKNIY